MKKFLICFLIFKCLPVHNATAQKSINIDSLEATHPPGRAALRSVILPGAGQAYNHKYWKIPLLYAGAGTLVYFAHFNNTEYKRFSTAYRLRNDGDSTTIDEFANTNLEASDLKTQKDYWRRNRDLCFIGLGALYILNIIDAYVDGHLFFFKVSDELALRIIPQQGIACKTAFTGINIQLNF